MRRTTTLVLSVSLIVLGLQPIAAFAVPWAKPVAPVIPETSGFVVIPNAAVPPQKTRIYRAIFEATRAADRPEELLPALDNAGSELNALGASGVPLRNARFVVVFHGASLDGILDDRHYLAKFGVHNPNLKALASLRRNGVELYVCGQNLAVLDLDPATLASEVKVASDALIVLMTYENDGYALIEY